MASYKQISKGNWKVTVSLGYENGKQIKTRKQGFKTKKDAEQWATEITSQKHKGYIFSTDSNILLKDFIQKWFYEYKIHTLAINTAYNYRVRINTHIIPKLGGYKLNKITTMVVQDFYNGLINDGLSPSSAKTVIQTFGTCLKYAKKNKLIYNLPNEIEYVPVKKAKVQFWTKEQIDFFLNEIKDHYLYTPIFIDVLTGLRIGEICGLRWGDIDLENGILTVRNQITNDENYHAVLLTSKLKTPSSYRKITLPQVLINYLKSIKNNALDSEFVTLNRKGLTNKPTTLSTDFSRYISKYKLPLDEIRKTNPEKNSSNYIQLPKISFHGLRHTHATLLIFNGENIKVVSERLGHKSITVTLDTYTHIMDDMKNNTATLLNNLFINTIPKQDLKNSF